MILIRVLLFVASTCISVTAASQSLQPGGLRSPLDVKHMGDLIKIRGVDEVLDSLFNVNALQEELLANIRSGHSAWLELFILLRDHPEAEQGSLLDLQLAYALQQNPEGVLRVIRGFQQRHELFLGENGFSHYASLICGNLVQDRQLGTEVNLEHNLVVIATKTLDARLAALLALEKTEFEAEKKLCTHTVEKAKRFWSQL